MDISLVRAQSIALYQNLHRFKDQKGKAGVLAAVQALGYVQIDTINVIERAHHHTLYNRVKDYHPSMLDTLFATDKHVWEYWGHAASYLPLSDYKYYKYRMQTFPNGGWELKYWLEHQHLAKPILDRIRQEGALCTRHFEDTRQIRVTPGWGDWKPAKFTLELLMWKGELIVTGRDNFQRVYDLTERVIPHHRDIEPPSETERVRFMILRTLQAHGIVSENDIKNHLFLAPKASVPPILEKMVKSGEIVSINIDGIKMTYFALAETLTELLTENSIPKRVYLLSPFDNAVILRPRLKQLFGFDYTLECYIPQSRRIYGYWTMPVLYEDKFVGRIDPKADRKTRTLLVSSLHIDKSVWKSKPFQTALEKELNAFSAFNGCDKYKIDNVTLT